ncbi:unnamed protein product, partial [Staurois parvus]
RTYTDTNVHTYTDTCTCTQTHVHTHVQYIHTDTCTIVRMYTYTPPPPPHKKLQYFVVHSQSRVLHSRGRPRAQHTLLALLSLRSDIEQSDGSRSGLSSKPAQQDGPGGHTHPHHNFHSPLASRRVEVSSP